MAASKAEIRRAGMSRTDGSPSRAVSSTDADSKIVERIARTKRRALVDRPSGAHNQAMPVERHPLATNTLIFRARYPEADPMGFIHHSRFLQYFEMGRIELLRQLGHSYAELERAGVFFAVTRVEVKYRSPGRFDDQLTLTTSLMRQGPVRLDHRYELRRSETLLAEGETTIACLDRAGQVRAIPDEMFIG
jgi:acyl-CoA thioester hydrolase